MLDASVEEVKRKQLTKCLAGINFATFAGN